MATTAQVIVDDVRDTLLDEGAVKRFSDSDLVRHLNTAILWLALVRPDSTAKTSSVQLAPGSKQAIPTDGLRLIDITRNMGVNGTTVGPAILPGDKATMDGYDRNWHAVTAAVEMEAYVYDDRNPKNFYVTPPVHASTAVYVEMVYSATPTLLTTGGMSANLPVDDVYYIALMKGMLSLAYGKSSGSTANPAKSRQKEIEFYQSLGIKYQSDRAVSPNEGAADKRVIK